MSFVSYPTEQELQALSRAPGGSRELCLVHQGQQGALSLVPGAIGSFVSCPRGQ